MRYFDLIPENKYCLEVHIDLLFRAKPTAYGSSQARGQIEAIAVSLPHSHSSVDPSHICDYSPAHGNAGFLTYSARPGIKPHPHGY